MPKRLYIIAGEASGDLHGAGLLHELKRLEPQLEFRGIGGDHMAAEGVALFAHIRDTNIMGFWEVVKNLRRMQRLFRRIKEDIFSWKADAVLLIDYPGFNLRMARQLHPKGIQVLYYISPQLWAWKKGRVKTIKHYVDHMMVILPFESDFYASYGVEVDFVGHPLLDRIQASRRVQNKARPLVALLPGSRKQEILRILPPMLGVCPDFPQCDFVVAGAPGQDTAFYQQIMKEPHVKLWMDRTYDLLKKADYALVASGTATLETALHAVPQVVCYRAAPISYFIGKRLIQTSHISLVNIILGRQAVQELIQDQLKPSQLSHALRHLMEESTRRRLLEDYGELRQLLGEAGASERAARLVGAALGGL